MPDQRLSSSVTTPPAGGGDAPSVDAVVAALVESLRAGAEELADRIHAELVGRLPSYRRLAEPTGWLVRQGTLDAIHVFSDLVAGGRGLHDDEAAEIERRATAGVELGIGHDDMAAACWLSLEQGCGYLAERAAALSPSPAVARGLGRVVVAACTFVEEAAAAIGRAHLAHHARQAADKERGLRELVDDLLGGQLSDDEETSARARGLGLDLESPLGLLFVLVPAAGGDRSSSRVLRSAVASCLAVVPSALDGPLRSSPVPHAVVVVPAPTSAGWERALDALHGMAFRERFVVLAADRLEALSQVGRACQDATGLLPVVEAAATPGVARPGDFASFRFLAANPTAARSLAEKTLGPVLALPQAQARRLLEALEALWEAGDRVSTAATALGLTEKAVRSRLERVKQLTGLDPARPPDRTRLDLARQALRLAPGAPGARRGG